MNINVVYAVMQGTLMDKALRIQLYCIVKFIKNKPLVLRNLFSAINQYFLLLSCNIEMGRGHVGNDPSK